MGFTQSKISKREPVARCKRCTKFIKQALDARNLFAAAHSAYAMSIRNAGAALCDFTQGWALGQPLFPIHAPMDTLQPPPAPPNFSPAKLHRFNSLPASIALSGFNFNPKTEEGDQDDEEPATGPSKEPSNGDGFGDEADGNSSVHKAELESGAFASLGGNESENKDGLDNQNCNENVRSANKTKYANLLLLVNRIDDCFLSAFESAHDVSEMMEANRMHYYLNSADNKGHIDHAARILRAVTWNRSPNGIHANDGENDLNTECGESHATILDKLLAWEMKLYEEVKAAELIKVEYHKKIALLKKQKKHSVNPEALEKTKVAVGHLNTRYTIDMQSMDSTISEIIRLRDARLYPKLVELVDGMARMWSTMHEYHSVQQQIARELRAVDSTTITEETSRHHYDSTVQLCAVLHEWNSHFQKLMTCQKQYIQALNSWLELKLIPFENSLNKVSSKMQNPDPPLQLLLQTWREQLEKLPVALVESTLSSFSAVMESVLANQQDELKHKKKCEDLRKEYAQKSQAFELWKQKQLEKGMPPPSEGVEQETNEVEISKNPVAERKLALEILNKKLDALEEVHKNLRISVREKSLMSLKIHLPELFRAMSEFTFDVTEAYSKVQAAAQAQGGRKQ